MVLVTRILGTTTFDGVKLIAGLAARIPGATPIAKATSLPAVDPAVFMFMLHRDVSCWRWDFNALMMLNTAKRGVEALSRITSLTLAAACVPHTAPSTEASSFGTVSVAIFFGVLQ